MKKVNKKRIILVIMIVLLISILPIFKGKNIYKYVSKSINNPIKRLSEERQKVYDKMKIEYVNIESRTTGTEPFNKEVGVSDTEGKDVSGSDDYVRTFDSMNYLVEVGISPNTTEEVSSLKGGVIKVKATLPEQGDKTIMRWEKDAWMQNATLSNDGRELTAEYIIPSNMNATNANQNLTFTVKIDGYKETITDNMKPTFEVWMEGNNPDNSESTANSVTIKDERDIKISGHESFDVVVVNGAYLNIRGERELNGVNTTGQYTNYDVAVALYQDDDRYNDLRGICYPSTEEFNVNLKMKYYYRLSNSSTWNLISENDPKASNLVNGTQVIEWGLNRERKDNYFPDSEYVSGAASLPAGRLGNPLNSVQNSGNMNLIQNNENLSVSFKNYTLNGIFPDRGWKFAYAQSAFAKYGFFAVGNFEVFIPYYDINGDDYVYQFTVQAESANTKNLKGETIELSKGSSTINDMVISNNSASISMNRNLRGSSWGIVRAYDSNGAASLDNLNDYGNGSAIIGKDFTIVSRYRMNDGPYNGGVDALLAWNSKTFKLEKMNDRNVVEFESSSVNGYPCSDTENLKYYFGIYKENPSEGITDNSTANSALHDDFIWYESKEEAERHGKICAIKVDDPDLEGFTTERAFKLRFSAEDNQDNVGKTGIFRLKWKFYEDEEKTKVFYYGGQDRYYASNGYTPAMYNSNGIISYEAAEEYGETILIVSEKTNVKVGVNDLSSNGKMKSSYDVQDGQINFKLEPSITNDNNPKDTDQYVDNIIVNAILPEELSFTYNNSYNKTPDSVVKNSDGTTTITWIYNHWQVNHPAPETNIINFSADISANINNNKKLEIKSIIKSDGDNRDEVMFRTSTYEINISNLAGSMALKEIDKNIIDNNESFNITNTLGNNGNETLNNIRTIEILPKNEDENGSSFSGTYTTKITSGATGQRFFYTTSSIEESGISSDQYGKYTIKDVIFDSDSRWIEVNLNEVIPSNATAIATYLPSLASNKDAKFVMQITPNGNKEYDKYVFGLNMTSDNLSSAVKTNYVVAQGVNRKISGIYFEDLNRNNVCDSEDNLLKGKKIKLIKANGETVETQTDSNGRYEFDKLDSGNYVVEFENNGSNYEIVEKGTTNNSSKAKNDYKSDIVNHSVQPTSADFEIENINIGVRKKESVIVTHHRYKGENTDFKTENQSRYFGTTYTTKPISNIPKNYELYSIPDNAEGEANSAFIDVIYVYQKKSSNISLTANLTGTDKITNKDDEVSYKLIVNGKITDYIGVGNITITSQLPYEIDESKSNLDGGIYDSNNKTITWSITKNVDSYENSNNIIRITRDYKVVYKDIVATDRNIKNTVSAKIQLDNNQSTDIVEATTGVLINGKINVFYYEKDENGNNIEIIPSKEYENLVGEKVTIESEVKGYEIIDYSESFQYTIQEGKKEVALFYKMKTFKISAKAMNDGGGVINGEQFLKYSEDSKKITIKSNEDFCIDSIVVNGEKQKIKDCSQSYELSFKNVDEDKIVEVKFKNVLKNPNTGDSITKYFVMFISTLVITLTIVIIKKKEFA